ncbi:MAG: aminodeoxychorismate/anthranilate synthase component II [Bacteroidota bacterium]
MILLLDNFDSFTYNLVDYFNQLSVECNVIRNDADMQYVTQFDYEGVVLSPGPSTPDQSGCQNQVIDFYKDKLPMLGICLGHQAIGQFFGAQLTKAIKPMHGKLSEIICSEDYLFEGMEKKFNVVRYHSLVLEKLSDDLSVLALTDVGEIMAFKHNDFPIRALQFHPEAALTQNGFQLLKNWVSFNKITN